MKIEVLYPKFCNFYGEPYNIKYLAKCSDKIKVYYTDIDEEPRFVSKDIDMVYVGAMSHVHQELIISKLKPYKDRIKELIEKNKIFLFTGDAIELVGNYILDLNTNQKIDGLGLFDVYFERNLLKRRNYFFLGDYKKLKMVGSVSTFSTMYGDDSKPFIKIVKGLGMGNNNCVEGINYKNFYATYLIGPILVLNPKFTKLILKKMGYTGKLCFEKDIMAAYEHRLKELSSDNARVVMSDHG